MGWFGNKKNKQGGATDYVNANDIEDGNNLPVATAVTIPDSDVQVIKQEDDPVLASQQQKINTYQTSSTSVHHQQQSDTTISYGPQFGRKPIRIEQCPYCNETNVKTKIRTYPEILTWLLAVLLLLLFWPICWIPFVLDSSRRTDHFCTKCHAKVGIRHAFTDCCEKTRR